MRSGDSGTSKAGCTRLTRSATAGLRGCPSICPSGWRATSASEGVVSSPLPSARIAYRKSILAAGVSDPGGAALGWLVSSSSLTRKSCAGPRRTTSPPTVVIVVSERRTSMWSTYLSTSGAMQVPRSARWTPRTATSSRVAVRTVNSRAMSKGLPCAAEVPLRCELRGRRVRGWCCRHRRAVRHVVTSVPPPIPPGPRPSPYARSAGERSPAQRHTGRVVVTTRRCWVTGLP